MLIFVASCHHSETSKNTEVQRPRQDTPPPSTTSPAISRSRLNQQLQSELSRILPVEAGETESPDTVQRVKALLDQGADVEAKAQGDDPPITLTARGGYVIVLKMLLDRGANVDAQNDHGQSALMLAASVKDHVMVQLLLARGANTKLKDENDSTALDWLGFPSSEAGYSQTLALLKRAAKPGFKPSSLKDPVLREPTQRAVLHRDNVMRLPLGRTLADIQALEETIQNDRDVEALAMMQKGKFTMIASGEEIEVLERNALHCRVKIQRTGKIGWVLCSWISPIR